MAELIAVPLLSAVDRFRRQVAVAAARPAIVDVGGRGLSYAELDERSGRIASHLRAAGVRPGGLVALATERTPDMVAALLAILRVGAAYLPLDPGYPRARLELMLADSGATHLLTDDPRTTFGGVAVVVLQDAVQGAGGDEIHEVGASDPVYVIYTSGSTGRPKGVVVPHGALANLLDAFSVTPGLSEHDRALAVTTLSFDIAALEIWLPLTTGAAVVLADRTTARDAHRLAALMARERVTWVQATPSTWRLLLDVGWRAGRGITALSGGEPLSRALADAILATGATLWNVYGPTETTVWSTLSRVAPSPAPILIGHPITRTTLSIRDDHGRTLPAGVTGELCIGGAGLALGYLARPELTAERFVVTPEGERVYRTGDAARVHASGEYECLGRLDHQLKVDGHRIEPGEIEAALSAVADLRQAVVVAREDPGGGQRLLAYICPGEGVLPAPAELRARLARLLPAHMIPSGFVPVASFPLTPNGKIDRAALPAPVPAAPSAAAPFATDTQRVLAALWCDVLELPAVGADEDFFALGGRSRLAARLFARIEATFGVRLPLATLFEATTVAALAARIDDAGRLASWSCLVPVRVRGGRPPFFCVHPIGGNVVSYLPLVERLGPDVPFYGLQSVGLDGRAAPLRTVGEMAAHYLTEVRRVQPRGPYHLGGASFGGVVAYEMAVQLRGAGQDVDLLALIDTEFPPCPEGGLFRRLARSRRFRDRVYPWMVRARAHARSLRRLGLASYVAALRGHTPRADEKRRRDPFTRALAAVEALNRRALENYVPPRYDGSLVYFRAVDERPAVDRRLAWRAFAARMDVHDVPGTHFSCRREPHVAVLAAALRERLTGRASTIEAA